MPKLFKIALPAMLALAVLVPGPSKASPTSTYSIWSWDGLYVSSYVAYSNGDIGVSFAKSNGVLFTNWNDQNGVAQCAGQPTLRLASAYGAMPEIQKTLLAAALSHKAL